jgi:hypothetical protein
MKCCNNLGCLCGIASLVVCLARLAAADPSTEVVTWNAGVDTVGWVQGGDAASVSSPATGGNPGSGGYLSVNFDAADPLNWQTGFVTNSGAGYMGNYSGLGLKFDLLGYGSSVQQLFFVSSAAGSNSTWIMTLVDPPALNQTWQTYNVSFKNQGSWYSGESVDFLTALSQVDSIGLIMSHFGTETPMQYGLDNWQFLRDHTEFYVPEPGVSAMVAMLMLSAAFWGWRAFRTRRA